MSVLNRYEVEIEVKNMATGVGRLETRLEHAYSVIDAVQQALLNLRATPSERLTIRHVGPPAGEVEKAAHDHMLRVTQVMVERRRQAAEARRRESADPPYPGEPRG